MTRGSQSHVKNLRLSARGAEEHEMTRGVSNPQGALATPKTAFK